jgi:hypothetical protein
VIFPDVVLKAALFIFLAVTVKNGFKKIMKARQQGTAPSINVHKMPTSPHRKAHKTAPAGVEMTEMVANEAEEEEDEEEDGDAPLLTRMRNRDANTTTDDEVMLAAPPQQDGAVVEETEKSETEKTLAAVMEKDAKIPYDKLCHLILVWLGLFLLNCLRGSKKAPSFIGIENCSVAWMGINVVIYVFLIGVTIILGIQLLSDYKNRVNLNFPFQAGEFGVLF